MLSNEKICRFTSWMMQFFLIQMVSSTQAAALPKDRNQSFHNVINYEKFRSLSRQNQGKYIRRLREIFFDFQRHGFGPLPKKKSGSAGIYQFLGGSFANAAEKVTSSNQLGAICFAFGWVGLIVISRGRPLCTIPEESFGCPGRAYKCNPLIYGENVCAPVQVEVRGKDLCAALGADPVDLAREISNPDLRSKWELMANQISGLCTRGPADPETCRLLSDRLASIESGVGGVPSVDRESQQPYAGSISGCFSEYFRDGHKDAFIEMLAKSEPTLMQATRALTIACDELGDPGRTPYLVELQRQESIGVGTIASVFGKQF